MKISGQHHKFSVGGLLVTLGIIFGDIGTSPLYVMQAITKGKIISPELVLGGVSCVLWTLIILTTVKYIYLALNADNKGEGGIFALYALVRRYNTSWVIYPAILGCATLIADGFITPPISISSAVEGITLIYPDIKTVPIVIGIIIAIFAFQQVGTQTVGITFGPIMFIWFTMIGILGFNQITNHLEVLAAFNPQYAINLLMNYPQGFWLLGAVFLCTTGGEALYSDLGHCGKLNIRISWSFVIVCLVLNYFGQAAWLLSNLNGQPLAEGQRIFFQLMPEWFLPIGIGIATISTIIASQALISGVFTLVNEAMKLHLWFRTRVNYPSTLKGQIYIPSINWFLMFGCIAVQLIFQTSENMEAAYGLAIIINMLMTTMLLSYYYKIRFHRTWIGLSLLIFYMCFETVFLISNIDKLAHGGWFTLTLTAIFATMVFVLYNAQKIRDKHTRFVQLKDFIPVLKDLQDDNTIQKEASHLVYLSMSESKQLIDSNIMYSILRKKPKRADVYWFVHVQILDEPYNKSFHVDTIVPKEVFFVHLRFGFKVEHRVNSMFHEIVDQMVASGEVSVKSPYPSIRKHHIDADFKFILLHTRVSADTELTGFEQWVVRTYRMIKKISLPAVEDFGLEMSNVEEEIVPILVGKKAEMHLEREH
ncbi:MAG: KUP/HAK/KT family potassium transporter [Saprospiraceae bacterium]|nr:KUP/HAK/KT family potassium transporter [Saprospiraceae bacterium]MBK8483216.1 KUP/HAK/KT family potassium transporter [Saprospiraceae bacterium]MBK9220729.1 KUP/HAK/KT family potassium transporter [Saprospiraceae bacterium]MBK9722426.1 KUP/HAK/KT family potassium transporter [Saprospiraceae bacterium]MBK9729450.1 KUP/HAK/KT family potassium transporter [Saprospiraceae bacterium]